MTIEEVLSKSVETLKKGGVILYPTDTVWGLGCDATNAEAAKRIKEIKKSDSNKPMLVLVDGTSMLEKYVNEVPEAAKMLMDVDPNPLTIVYDSAYGLPDEICAEDGSIGIRITNNEFCKKLCAALKRPIVSTSANISGTPTATELADISDDIRYNVDFIADYPERKSQSSVPSNVIKVSNSGVIKILR